MKAVFFGNKNLHKIPPNLPIFLLGGAHDACTNFGKDMSSMCERLTDLGNTNLTCKILEGTRHESLNELNLEEAFDLYLTWLNKAME